MTSAQFLAHLDAANEALSTRAEQEIEAVRIGTILAHDAKAYRRWTASMRRARGFDGGGGLTGAALEKAVRSFGIRHPEYVVIQ